MRLTLGLVQVSVAVAGLMLAVGGVLSSVMVALAVAVQPVAEVTVTEYVPALLTVRMASVELSFQR